MKRILVVEDERTIAHFLKRGLTYKGFEVLIAWNGEEALTAVRTFSPDLVVLDVMLPDIDGREVCRLGAGWVSLSLVSSQWPMAARSLWKVNWERERAFASGYRLQGKPWYQMLLHPTLVRDGSHQGTYLLISQRILIIF